MTSATQMTQSLEDYIETVYLIILDGRVAQVRDIARALGKEDDAARFAARAHAVHAAFQKAFYRPEVQVKDENGLFSR